MAAGLRGCSDRWHRPPRGSPTSRNKPERGRLSADDWAEAALDLIAEQGVAAVAVEPLARRLGVTKGSFYWHFADLPTYRSALIEAWGSLADQDRQRFEDSGQLEGMLTKIADFYEAEVDAKVKALTSLIEPVMIVVVGSVVGFIVISMYLPIFKLYDQIR